MSRWNPEPVEQRFWRKVKIAAENECWLWVAGGHDRGGAYNYGVFPVQYDDGEWGYEMAHRFSWKLANGPIPEGMEVCHNCPGGDVPACVNPSHLFLGTHADNMADMGRKGRAGRNGLYGEAQANSKLKSSEVIRIRERLTRGDTLRAIAIDYGVQSPLIWKIKAGLAWKWLKG